MNWSRILAQAELALPPLYRRREELLERLESLSKITDPQVGREATWQLSLDFPGLGSIGELINLSNHDRQNVLVGLTSDEQTKQFVEKLIARIDQDPELYTALGQVMPLSFPPPKAPILDGRAPETNRGTASAKSPPASPDDPRKPLPPLLSRLAIGLSSGRLQPSLSLADSVRGSLAGQAEMPNLQLQLQILPEGQIKGVAVNQAFPDSHANENRFILPIRDQAELYLADGSHLNAEMSWATLQHLSIGAEGSTNKWNGWLSRWYWWKKEDARYWVGLSSASISFSTVNLRICGSFGMGMGLHIPGVPSLTLVRQPGPADKTGRAPFAIVIEALKQNSDDKPLIVKLCVILQSVLSIPIPQTFYGYNDRAEICAAMQVHHGRQQVDDIALPGAACNFIPSLRIDALQSSGRVWMAPFLQKLRTDAQKRVSQTMDSMSFFRWVTEEPIMEFQIDKLGKAIRILLHSEGVLRNDDYLNPSRVFAVLRTFAKTRGIRLPEGTQDALDLSHRLALLGSRGVSPRRLESSLDFPRAAEAMATLRTAYASLVAGLIGYTGPLFKGLTPDRSASLVHSPLLQPDPVAVAWDEAAAQERFEATESEQLSYLSPPATP